MGKEAYACRSEVWIYPGAAAWHFVNVDKKQSAKLREKYGAHAKGFGSIPVEVKIGKSVWQTSIFPDKRSGTYLLPLKAGVRKAEGIEAKDMITFRITIR